MRLYIGRKYDIGVSDGYYELGTIKALWTPENGFAIDGFLVELDMDIQKFEKIFKFKLAPGEIRKVKAIKIEVE